jgi:hypothetical protein
MTAQTITDIAHGWPTITTAPIQADTRPILCRGVGCNCRQYVKYDHVAGYDVCACRHSYGTHIKPATTTTKPAKKKATRS